MKDSVARTRIEFLTLPIALLQEISVQAGLGGWHQGVVLRTQPELEVSHVVGGQLYLHLHPLVHLIDPGDHSSAKLSSSLIISGLKHNNSDKIFQTQDVVVRISPLGCQQ